MKIIPVIIKGFREQIRSFWVLLLSLSMGPLFIMIYYLIIESSEPVYKIIVINNDKGVTVDGKTINHGKTLTDLHSFFKNDTFPVPFRVTFSTNLEESKDLLRNKKADALIVIHPTFSEALEHQKSNPRQEAGITITSHPLSDTILQQKEIPALYQVEFIGDLTNVNYLISAVWANEFMNEFALGITQTARILQIKETPLGISSKLSNFDLVVPGILMVSLIMLMFTASIAFVSEVENKTILRLKLSDLSALEFVGGVTFVQWLLGIFSVILTLLTALALGFQYAGSMVTMIFIASLTCLSLIAFSLIIAALTKTAAEILVVGNFPMFLFMFFTGAAFPMNNKAWFTIAGYPVNPQGLMSPTHAISALNKTFIMDMGMKEILPEIMAICLLTVLYFAIGAILFKRRHLSLSK